MSSSCQGLRDAFKECLFNSDCVHRDGNLPSDCIRNHFEELPVQCKYLRQALLECKRGMLDMRKRLRGNVVGARFEHPKEDPISESD